MEVDISKVLKSQGFKNTKARKAIIDILLSSNSPLSISQILEKLAKISITPNKTTVYREINFLKGLDIIKEVDFGDGKKMYEISSNHHHHIRCIKCGLIKDVEMQKDLNFQEDESTHDLTVGVSSLHGLTSVSSNPRLNSQGFLGDKILKKMGFKPIGHSLEFFGLCTKCQD